MKIQKSRKKATPKTNLGFFPMSAVVSGLNCRMSSIFCTSIGLSHCPARVMKNVDKVKVSGHA